MSEATFGLRTYRDTFTDRISEVEAGQTHVLTKHGRLCARIVPTSGPRDVAGAIAAIRGSREKSGGNLWAAIVEGRL